MIEARNLSPDGEAANLVDALWAAYREDRRDLHVEVSALIEHDDPVVREEAVSLLLVKWRDRRYRSRAAAALINDEDFGVRGRAAIGLASVSSAATRREDIRLLLRTLRAEDEDPETRRASYEALLLMAGRTDFPSRSQGFDPVRNVDWDWVLEQEGGNSGEP